MKNPYQSVVDWLKSDQGWDWQLSQQSNSIHNAVLYNIKDDQCRCFHSVVNPGLYHEGDYFCRGANLNEEGPFQAKARDFVKGIL